MTEPPPASPQGSSDDAAKPAARQPTTSLSAFQDLQPGDESEGSVRTRLMSGSPAGLALIGGLVVAVVTAVVGVVGSLGGVQENGFPVIVALFVVLAAAAVLITVTAVRAVLSHRRTGSGGVGQALIGAVVAVASVVMLGLVLFLPNPAVRAGSGQIVEAGPMRFVELLQGDCLTEVPATRYDDPVAETHVVPCSEPHAVEVVAVLPFEAEDAQALASCVEATSDNGRLGDVHTVAPTAEVRDNYGLGQLLCLQA